MRILLLGNDLSPIEGGGYTLTQDIVIALLRHAAASRHEFFIPDSISNDPFRNNLPRNFKIIPRAHRSLWDRVTARVSAKSHEFFSSLDVTHDLSSIRGRVDCALNLVPMQSYPRLPNIVTVWDLEHRRKAFFPEVSANGQWEQRERFFRTELPKALAVIAGTDVGKAQIERFYGVDPALIRVISLPTPSFTLEHAAALQNHRDSQTPAGMAGEYVFYPAQFWPHKNHIRLIEALKLVVTRHGWDGSVVFCGSDKGNLQYLIGRATELGVRERIHFKGFVGRDELIALYSNALALVFVSYFGPDNLPPLEAFALNCPVIASDVEGAKQYFGDAALLIDPDDASDIADAIWRVKTESGLRERLIVRGRSRALHSTAAGYVEQLIDLLDWMELRFKCFRSV